MNLDFREVFKRKYRDILAEYLKDEKEQALYLAQKLSRESIEHKVSPEEIVSMHKSLMMEIVSNVPKEVLRSFDILIEMMVGYGLAYREHQSLRNQQQELKSEIAIASEMQQTLLRTRIPQVEGLDIGAISVAAKHMSGDYYHFIQDDNNFIGVAIADVIGKGIPAALCMSMIKYAMDSMPDSRHQPSYILESLNRVVEHNVDPSMFITMFYGMYDPSKKSFLFASAGHEPGFYYDKKAGEFTDLYAKGLLLGIEKKTTYRQYEKHVNVGDMIVLLSDGVTECRTKEGFIERSQIVRLIEKNMHLHAQDIVNNVYKELERLQEFQLRDDFTLIILKRTS